MYTLKYSYSNPTFVNLFSYYRYNDLNISSYKYKCVADCIGMKICDGIRILPGTMDIFQQCDEKKLVVIGWQNSATLENLDFFLHAFPPHSGRIPCLVVNHYNHSEAEKWIYRVKQEWGFYPWIAATHEYSFPSDTITSMCKYWGIDFGPNMRIPSGVGEAVAHMFTNGVYGPPAPSPRVFQGISDASDKRTLVPISSLLIAPNQLKREVGWKVESKWS